MSKTTQHPTQDSDIDTSRHADTLVEQVLHIEENGQRSFNKQKETLPSKPFDIKEDVIIEHPVNTEPMQPSGRSSTDIRQESTDSSSKLAQTPGYSGEREENTNVKNEWMDKAQINQTIRNVEVTQESHSERIQFLEESKSPTTSPIRAGHFSWLEEHINHQYVHDGGGQRLSFYPSPRTSVSSLD